jgi:hypothetical protein
MMKKLLIFMLVLCMASMANAVLQISVDGDPDPVDTEIWLLPSETLLLNIHSVGGDTGDSFFALVTSGVGVIDGTSGVTYIPDAPDASMLLGPAGPAMNFIGGLGARDGVAGTVGSFTAVPPYADGIYFDLIEFHCLGEGDVLIELIEVDSVNWTVAGMPVMDSVVIHQIPEPMTVLLLGLGGLFLRRRK